MTPSTASSYPASNIPPRLKRYFDDYAAYHRTRGNQITHYFGITMIVISLLGLLGDFPIADGFTSSSLIRLDGGTVLWMAALSFYLFLDWRLALPFGVFSYGLYFLGRDLETPVLWGLFVAGWILQFIGHGVYEKKSPAFLKNGTHLLIGPLWIFAKWVGYVRPAESKSA